MLISGYELPDGPAGADDELAAGVRSHYSRLLYRAVLSATKGSLRKIKARVASRASAGFLFLERPFFDVNVELTIPNVSMSPTLDEVQAAINHCSRAILHVGKALPLWPKVLYAPLPLLHVTGVLAANKDAGAGAYNCPCYKSPMRGGLHFVFDVDLRTEDPPARWILRGVCLLTTKD